MTVTARATAFPDLRVGVIPMPDFTMLAFSGFIDTLRLAADEGDRSRPIRCSWTVMSEGRAPVRASNGIVIQPHEDFGNPNRFDYVVVVGGVLREEPCETPRLFDYLRQADAAGICLIGLCTGSLTLARAGLMDGRAACVSWFHHNDYVAEFPRHLVVSDRLFLDAGDRITCAGGVSVVHLASWLVERHCGPGAADKGLRIMIEEQERERGGATPQPAAALAPLRAGADVRVRRALLAMDRRIAEPLRIADLAGMLRVSERQLTRLFRAELQRSPAQALLDLRLTRARRLIANRNLALSDIAAACGFADSAHLTKRFRGAYAVNPSEYRRTLLATVRSCDRT